MIPAMMGSQSSQTNQQTIVAPINAGIHPRAIPTTQPAESQAAIMMTMKVINALSEPKIIPIIECQPSPDRLVSAWA